MSDAACSRSAKLWARETVLPTIGPSPHGASVTTESANPAKLGGSISTEPSGGNSLAAMSYCLQELPPEIATPHANT